MGEYHIKAMPFQQEDSVDTIVENIKKLQMETIRETADLLNKEALNRATDYLDKARHVEIFCNSPNTYSGELFKRKLITIGKSANVAASGETGIVTASLGPQDCALIISYSGNSVSQNPVNRIGILKKNHVPIIGITSGEITISGKTWTAYSPCPAESASIRRLQTIPQRNL